MTLFPAQSDAMPVFYQAMRERFATGITTTQLLILIGLVVLLVVVVAVLRRFEGTSEVQPEPDHAGQLFHDVLVKLEMPAGQRQILDTISRELRLTQPAVLLLSEKLFDDHLADWKERSRSGRLDEVQDELLRKIRNRLFPSGVGWVASPGA